MCQSLYTSSYKIMGFRVCVVLIYCSENKPNLSGWLLNILIFVSIDLVNNLFTLEANVIAEIIIIAYINEQLSQTCLRYRVELLHK